MHAVILKEGTAPRDPIDGGKQTKKLTMISLVSYIKQLQHNVRHTNEYKSEITYFGWLFQTLFYVWKLPFISKFSTTSVILVSLSEMWTSWFLDAVQCCSTGWHGDVTMYRIQWMEFQTVLVVRSLLIWDGLSDAKWNTQPTTADLITFLLINVLINQCIKKQHLRLCRMFIYYDFLAFYLDRKSAGVIMMSD